MLHITRWTALGGLLAVALLTGCATDAQPSASPDPEPTSSSPPPEPTPPEEPAPVEDPADPSTWIIDETGIGPLDLGGVRADAVAQLSGFTAESSCPNPNVTVLTGPSGESIVIADGIHGMIAAVAVGGTAGPVTAEGIHVGSTVGETKAAYPTAVASARYGATDQFSVESTTGWITFQGEESSVDSTPISLISVVLGGTPPNEYCG